MPHNTRPNPARRVKIPASSYSHAPEGGIQGHFFVLCFHVLYVPVPTLTNTGEPHLCTLSNARCVGCASLHLVLLCDIAVSTTAFTIGTSNANQTSALSSGPQDPKGPQDGRSLEFEVEMIDADVLNVELPESGDVQPVFNMLWRRYV